MKKILKGFEYAFQGLLYAFTTQVNFKIHIVAMALAVILGFAVSLNANEWLWITAAIGIVLIAELINTSIEVLVDLVSPEFNKKAGTVKDLSAAAVLTATVLAIGIALLVFVPKFLDHAS